MSKKAKNAGLLLFTAILLGLMLILVFYDNMVITVPSGHVGVYYDWLLGGTDLRHVYGEGVHLIPPWNRMFLYDCRSQKADYDVTVLVAGGLKVVVHSSIIWRVLTDSAAQLHVTAGPDYQNILIAPAMTAAIRSAAGLQPDLYSEAFNAYSFEEDILTYVQQFLNNGAFNFQAVLFREIELPERMLTAINEKFAAEQGVLEQRYNVQRAYENFKQRYIDAEGIRIAARIMNEGLTENYLRYEGVDATRRLAESPNAKLVIIGDKDGLPLVLNPDTLAGGQGAAAPAPGEGETNPNPEQARPALEMESISEYLNRLNERLNELGEMPEYDSSTLPQESGTSAARRLEGE
ncbi:MAG: prohibitin family protein [Spirochaetaceae bacterium]|jgi:regulator of protease activity HflC (stomatin/prohibitin superfamily)|nr:prohibitin family protein [Spirochaetaceae bacterium]